MSALLRRARPLSWTRSAERHAVFLPSAVVAEGRRQFGTVKAILTDDVDGTGYRGEYVEIRGGFMRNFLFPTKRAIYATDENRRIYEAVDRTTERERAEALKALKRGRQDLSRIPIILKRTVPTEGKGVVVFGQAVRAKDISSFLKKNTPYEIAEEDVRLGKPIATLGKHAVLVRPKLSESAVAILSEEVGVKELEKRAWVKMEVIIEQAGAKAKRKQGEMEMEDGAEEQDESGNGEGKEEGSGDMSVQ